MNKKVQVTAETVGLIVRGKHNDAHEPGALQQHADCILPLGQPIGFFGEGESGTASGSRSSMAKSNQWGMNMMGAVYDYQALRRRRAHYVDA